jgi:hypothetical protein
MDNFCIIVNTVSSCSDIWEMFFTELDKYFPNQKVYVFSDVEHEILNKYNVVLYDKNLDFRTQYLNCLRHVEEEYFINMNDDYVLFNTVNIEKLNELVNILKTDENISFIRVGKGYNNTNLRYKDTNLFYLDPKIMYFYSQTPAVWKTETLIKIHELSPVSSIGRKDNLPQLELVANDVCINLKLTGLYYYDNEPIRGHSHYDSSIFPYIASALMCGTWNIREYNNELMPLIQKYNIDINKRGVF